MYADDLVLYSESKESSRRSAEGLGRVRKRRDLRVNLDKSKVMALAKSPTPVMLFLFPVYVASEPHPF